MRLNDADVAVIGAGVVGLAAALVAAEQGLQVALVEAHEVKAWNADQPDLRVLALARDSQALFDALGVWQSVIERRAYPYSAMQVCDAVQTQPLRFNAADLGHRHLGHIVENDLLAAMLWQRVCQHPLIRRYCPDRVTGLQAESESVSLQLQDAGMLNARLVFGCDGAASKVRSLAGIETDSHDYHQKGLVAYVETELSHRDTAWQRFLNTGPLAFLPFGEKRCSIVWSLPDDKAEELLSATPEAFCRALDSAFAGTLGKTRLLSNRAAFPLKRSLAKTVLKGRVLLLGDAAHAVHPLAGQGVNLGLRDVSALRAAFAEARSRNGDALDLHGLQRWARQRYSDNALAALFFENINRLYSNDSMLLSVLRGNLFGLTDRLGPVKNALARHAAGL